MPKKKRDNDNPILGFLLGLAGGTIVYAFLSLFAKPKCDVCGATVEKNLKQCPYCDADLRY